LIVAVVTGPFSYVAATNTNSGANGKLEAQYHFSLGSIFLSLHPLPNHDKLHFNIDERCYDGLT